MIQKLGSTLIKLLPGSQRTLEREELTELLEDRNSRYGHL